ncbi:DUF4142 domain-containing protein [Modicisalibacter luteus]|uniref:DUF4142 domain-containing protein n=1 Tax=Modicisalibacter luteus TaxID=453962 RepID=A0ABV7M708_9GAMM|nr:DUF4142 domain-containing protein [Halomonas lutea]GHB13429.1 hypothetical protein GCM10007159_39700 [Halomonas lutea]
MKCHQFAGIAVLLGASFGPAIAAPDMTPEELLATLNALHQRQAEIAELAEQRADRAGVSDLAEALQQDHIILADWLAQAAEGGPGDASAVSLPGSDTYQQLKGLDGEKFDTAFLRYQTQLHEHALELLEQNLPEESELFSYTNLIKVTHEAMRKHLALIQVER